MLQSVSLHPALLDDCVEDQVGSWRYRSLIEGLYVPCRSLMEALDTLNSPPVVFL